MEWQGLPVPDEESANLVVLEHQRAWPSSSGELGGPGPLVVKAAAAIQCKTPPSAGVGRWVGDSMMIGQAGSALPAAKSNAPVGLQIDRARAKTRKQDTTRPRNRSLPGADNQ